MWVRSEWSDTEIQAMVWSTLACAACSVSMCKWLCGERVPPCSASLLCLHRQPLAHLMLTSELRFPRLSLPLQGL